MKTIINNKSYQEERALYGVRDADIINCSFAGEADGESALKECRRINIENCSFSLRYPIWHAEDFNIRSSQFKQTARAPLWYSTNVSLVDCTVDCVKFLRECKNINFEGCSISSSEFGWKCSNISLFNTEISSDYLFLDTKGLTCESIRMSGKYSFQYTKDVVIKNSILNTKDAFWHSENIRVENSYVSGEYLGWFSKGLTLVNCRISGTQPFCYCDDLTLINCTMEECDLSFEYSSVDADILGHIDSVKNIKSGNVTADSVGEIINDDPVMECTGKITIR